MKMHLEYFLELRHGDHRVSRNPIVTRKRVIRIAIENMAKELMILSVV
jgi:hypothetical protein